MSASSRDDAASVVLQYGGGDGGGACGGGDAALATTGHEGGTVTADENTAPAAASGFSPVTTTRAFGTLQYGVGKRCPVTFQRQQLPGDVLQHLWDVKFGSPGFLPGDDAEVNGDDGDTAAPAAVLAQSWANNAPDFEKCVDYPRLPQHIYYEGKCQPADRDLS